MKRKLILIMGLVVIVVVIASFISLNGRGTAVNIIVIPADSKLSLDGHPIKAGRVVVERGQHTFIASRQYFDDDKMILDEKALSTQKTIYLLPEPNSPEAIKWLSEHPDVQLKRESVGGKEAIAAQQDMTTNHPVISSLPHESLNYKIDYSVNAANKVSFNITLYPLAKPDSSEYEAQVEDCKKAANTYLTSKGEDISKDSITYTIIGTP